VTSADVVGGNMSGRQQTPAETCTELHRLKFLKVNFVHTSQRSYSSQASSEQKYV